MKTKRYLGLALSVLMLFSLLAGCGGDKPEPSDPSGDSTASTTVNEPADPTGEDTTVSTDVAEPTDTTTAGEPDKTDSQKTTAGKGTTTAKKPDPTQPKPTQPKPVSSSLKQADYISNAKLWSTPQLPVGPFHFELEISSPGPRNPQLLKNTIRKAGLGQYISLQTNVKAAEWGYSVLNIGTGGTDGAGRVMNNTFLDHPPKNRQEAIPKLKDFVINQYVKKSNIQDHPWYSMNGHHSWHHYAGEFGFDILASEIGENIHGYQFHIAMNRGAARQYQKPWAIDFSSWHGAGILDYTPNGGVWKNYSGPDRGHSLNLVERSFLMSYMSGADGVVAEAGGTIATYLDTEKGLYKITPYGEVCKKFNAFTQAHTDVGVTYTPIGVALDYYHGMDRHPGGNKAFGRFAYNAGDEMTHRLVETIWPGTWDVERNGNETGALSNGPYGDTVDFMLQNAPQEVLNSYPAIILSGDITLTAQEVKRYEAYVNQGGTLVLNTAYLKQFPAYKGTLANDRYDKTVGKGKVIVYGPDYDTGKLDSIIRELLAQYMPFKMSTNIQHMVNIRDGYMYVTLMNSDGVTKTAHAKPQVNKSKAKGVTVTYTGSLGIESVKDIYGTNNVSLKGKDVTLRLDPGEMAVLEYKFK